MMSTRPAPLASSPLFTLAFLFVFLLAPTSLSADGPAEETTPSAEPSSATSAEETPPRPLGVTVFVDPETGELTDQPTAAQEAWLREELQRHGKVSGPEAFQPRPVPLLQGGEGLALHDFVVSSTVLVKQSSGTWKTTCQRPGAHHAHDHPELKAPDPESLLTTSEDTTSDDAAPVM